MKAVIYARYSSDNQTEASIEGQLRECMEFAERAEIDVGGNRFIRLCVFSILFFRYIKQFTFGLVVYFDMKPFRF